MSQPINLTEITAVMRRIARALGAVLTAVVAKLASRPLWPVRTRCSAAGSGFVRSRRVSRGIAWATRGQGSTGAASGAAGGFVHILDSGGLFEATFFYGLEFSISWQPAGFCVRSRHDRAAFREKAPHSPFARHVRTLSQLRELIQ